MSNNSEPGSVEGAEVRVTIVSFARYFQWLDPVNISSNKYGGREYIYFLFMKLVCEGYGVVLSGQLVINTLFDQEDKGKVEEGEEEEKLLVPGSPPSPRFVFA